VVNSSKSRQAEARYSLPRMKTRRAVGLYSCGIIQPYITWHASFPPEVYPAQISPSYSNLLWFSEQILASTIGTLTYCRMLETDPFCKGNKFLYSPAVSVTVHGGPYVCDTSRLPQLLDHLLTDGDKVVSLTRRSSFIPRKIPGTHFC
jgi:hypothetical protein